MRCSDPLNAVYTVLNNPRKGLSKPLLVHVMLILPNPYGLGVDLYQLGKRILKPSGNGNRTS